MDCEKFESHLIDELYDELDEVTSAAAKRHVAGCARCSALLSGLKATRRRTEELLPIVQPPADLEERILAAAKEAQKVVPIRGRLSRAISWAGARAMQPQTAMAAIFLIMIGTSALFLKGKHAQPPASAMKVSDEGEPVAAAAAPSIARPVDLSGAISGDGKIVATAPAASAAPGAAATATTAVALDDTAASEVAKGGGYAGRAAAPAPPSFRSRGMEDKQGSLGGYASSDALNAAPPAGAPQKKEAYASGGGGAYPTQGPSTPVAQATPPPPPMQQATNAPAKASAKDDAPASDFDLARQAYDQGDYANAESQFNTLAAVNNDLNAAYWAAKSDEGANGCSSALPLYLAVMRRGAATRAGYDAQLAAGRCYRATGDYTNARNLLTPLLTVQSHMALAQAELAQMGKGGSPNAHAARAAPAPKAAPKASKPQPAATTDSAY